MGAFWAGLIGGTIIVYALKGALGADAIPILWWLFAVCVVGYITHKGG